MKKVLFVMCVWKFMSIRDNLCLFISNEPLGGIHDVLQIGREDHEERAEKTTVLDLQFVALFTLHKQRIAANQ